MLRSFSDKRFRIILVGAGFSKPAGLPLGTELFPEVLARADAFYGSDNPLEEDLRDFLEYKRRCDGIQLDRNSIDFEEMLS
jgi:hypothetical protein